MVRSHLGAIMTEYTLKGESIKAIQFSENGFARRPGVCWRRVRRTRPTPGDALAAPLERR